MGGRWVKARRLTKGEGPGRVVELFAGVGGFRVGLERSGWQTVWANQWEPSTKAQHAADCYRRHWDDGTLVNADIATVIDDVPEHDLLVGGFPCQDYSVAKPLNQAHGIKGKKGVLWWQIYRLIEAHKPRFVLLENVDRLLKSPGSQRGRDFAIILSCFRDLGYAVEWRVINAADYGFPQKRRRVFILAQQHSMVDPSASPFDRILRTGILARAFPVVAKDPSPFLPGFEKQVMTVLGSPHEVTLK